jgi:hypothetical protein
MAVKKFKARVKVASGNRTEVRIEAASTTDARKLLEAQYGKGSVVGAPQPVRDSSFVGARSNTETIVAILEAFLDRRTWRKAELACHLGVTTSTIHKRLCELQPHGIPLSEEREHPHVYWSVPKTWYPGGCAAVQSCVTTQADAQRRRRTFEYDSHRDHLGCSRGLARMIEALAQAERLGYEVIVCAAIS